jgi:diguanylate cyclase (GGDEF)-like protein
VVRDITLQKQNEAALKKAVEREQALAQTDYLTGAANARAFEYLLQQEINRLDRYQRPFAIAYIDLDDFKLVNDQLGHDAGDAVLRTVVQTGVAGLRKTDSVARLGGDEFALLLTETGPELAQLIVSGIHRELLAAMRRNNWPVTFSIGVVTCTGTPRSPHELLKLADDQMYAVKNSGKNGVRFSIFEGENVMPERVE